MEIDTNVSNNIVKRISKFFKKKIAVKIEKSINIFSIDYANVNETPFLLEQIYNTKAEELLHQFKESKLLINKLNNKEIDYDKIAFLKVEELHPEKYDKIIKKKNLEEVKKNNKKTTSAYKCSKCGEKKTLVEEKQTRAGDEPPTVFVECVVCGNKWTVG
tara:strand:+ start:157 stop:636 length:480 start_codon:yes stop_codon:yes gene_type:complete